jgi:hypothetical protein
VTGRRRRKLSKLMDDRKERRGYSNGLNEYVLLITTITTHLKFDVWEENTMCALIAEFSISYMSSKGL